MPIGDEEYMRMAIQLATFATGRTSPNPLVGAVLVKGNRIVGFGAHLQSGKKHAEIHALDMAADDAFESTLYVTLEPCAHYGKTPPCAHALVKAGIQRAVIAMRDPFSLVAGKGIAILRDAGITVEVGLLESEARSLNKIYLHYIEHQRPFVTLKLAASMDGWIATTDGTPLALTGTEAQRETHQLRNQVDAIMVGVNTIIQDNPQLTTRQIANGRNPIRYIFDHMLRTPVGARVVTDQAVSTVILCSPTADPTKAEELRACGVEVVHLHSLEEDEMIREALALMGERGLRHVLLEGGSTLAQAFLDAQAVDEVWMFHAPVFLGSGWPTLKQSHQSSGQSFPIRLKDIVRKTIGADELTIGTPVYTDETLLD